MTYLAQRLITKAVVDTSPLFSALTLRLVRNSPRPRRKSILDRSALPDYLAQSTSRQEAFTQFFGSIPTILTTPHVIAEVQGLLKREFQREFWSDGMEMLSSRGLDEKSVPFLLEMHKKGEMREGVCTIGPIDTGLIELARQEGCTLLTDDERTLARRARELGVDCILLRNMIP